MTNTKSYQVGDTVEFRPRGSMAYRKVVVIAQLPSVNGGGPGFTGHDPADARMLAWAYNRQITEVFPKA